MSEMDVHERKKLQNKLSQRKHRQKQKQRIEELEVEIAMLNKRLNQCIYEDKSKAQLLKIYMTTQKKIQNVNKGLNDLQAYLRGEIFSSIKDDLAKMEAGEPVFSDKEEDDSDKVEAVVNGICELDDEYDSDDDGREPNGTVSPATAAAIESFANTNIPSLLNSSNISNINHKSNGNTKIVKISSNPLASFQTNGDFNLNDFGIFDFNHRYQHSSTSRVDPNSVLRYYLYNEMSTHPPNLLSIINGIGIQSIAYINKIPQDEDIISHPHFLNMVCSYANNLFEQIPKFKNFAFAFGGVKWLVGQVLFFALSNPNMEPLIKPLLFKSNNFNHENYQVLVDNITKYLEISWVKDKYSNLNTNTSLFLLHSDNLFPVRPEGTTEGTKDPNAFILHEWFYPTALQTYMLKHSTYHEYPHWINFIIWPEMRDILLLNIHKLTMDTQDLFYNDLMDSVVLVLKDWPTVDASGVVRKQDKLFFFVDLTVLINLTINKDKAVVSSPTRCEPQLEYLTKHGLFSPGEWKLTRRYARKFGSLIPKKLVCWDIDDCVGDNIVRPHYAV